MKTDNLDGQLSLLAKQILAGQGKTPCDLVVRDVRLLDVISGSVTQTDIGIVGDRIVGTCARYEGETVIDGRGRFAVHPVCLRPNGSFAPMSDVRCSLDLCRRRKSRPKWAA